MNFLAVSEPHTLCSAITTVSFSKDVIPLLRSSVRSVSVVSTGKHWAPRRMYGTPSLALTGVVPIFETIKTQISSNGELCYGIVSTNVHA
jgi:hypothetical protein